MSLRNAFTATRIIESADNYTRADDPLTTKTQHHEKPYSIGFDKDEYFWRDILSQPEEYWGKAVYFNGAVVSEWVARVPGLFWTAESGKLRRFASGLKQGVVTISTPRRPHKAFDLGEKVALASERWHVYHPPGKSMKVSGGIGTMRLPPSPDGWRLMTLTTTCNASAGVPALMSADVCDRIKRTGSIEGCVLNGEARWQAMDLHWSQRFPTTRGVPRGYLVLDNPDRMDIHGDHLAPTQIHPFTIMEYSDGNRELFDFVYATGDTGEANYRGQLERFFDFYKSDAERHGRYLLSADMLLPMWDAKFSSPADLRRADASAGSQLSLLERRVRERMLGQNTLDTLLTVVTEIIDIDAWRARARMFGQDIGLGTRWLQGGNPAEVASQLVDAVAEAKKDAELVAYLVSKYPVVMQAHTQPT